MIESEIWKPIKGFESLYLISNLGRLKSFHRDKINGKVINPTLTTKGYFHVHLYRAGEKITARIHQLVAQAFIGDCPKDHQVNHKNGNKTDNRASNLEYLTMSENIEHAKFSGLYTKGTKRPASKLTENDVREIRKLSKQKLSSRKIGEMFGVGKTVILRIRNGENWKHVK
jgi:hypothetical protein